MSAMFACTPGIADWTARRIDVAWPRWPAGTASDEGPLAGFLVPIVIALVAGLAGGVVPHALFDLRALRVRVPKDSVTGEEA